MYRTNHIMFPHSNAKMRTLNRSIGGKGYGSVLLDNGMGGQSSYNSIDHYIETTGRNPETNEIKRASGRGLADLIAPSLSKLAISSMSDKKPKRKNITMSL